MKTILDVATVERGGDQIWTRGFEFQSVQCALSSQVVDVCLPGNTGGMRLSGTPGNQPIGFRGSVFGVVVALKQSMMCVIEDTTPVITGALEGEESQAAARALWFGTGFSDAWLGAPEVRGVTAGADTAASVAAILQAFWDGTTGLDPVLHLGIKAAMDLSFYITDDGILRTLNVPIVISSAYPSNGIAVTGPILVKISDDQEIDGVSYGVNKREDSVNRLMAVQFDPCAAFVIGEPPIQTYYTVDPATNLVIFYIRGNETSATIDWKINAAPTTKSLRSNVASLKFATAHPFTVGDSVTVALSAADPVFDGTQTLVAPSATVTNKALTSNVATLTFASHPYEVGDVVTVAGVDATFNGTYTVTGVTGTTITYAKTAANVTSTASGGTVTSTDPTKIWFNKTNANVTAAATAGAVSVAPVTVAPNTLVGTSRVYALDGSYSPTVTYATITSTYPVTV